MEREKEFSIDAHEHSYDGGGGEEFYKLFLYIPYTLIGWIFLCSIIFLLGAEENNYSTASSQKSVQQLQLHRMLLYKFFQNP